MSERGRQSDTPHQAAIRLRRRPDLAVVARDSVASRDWVVKDPIALRYYHLCDEEYAILNMLDGRITLAELRRQFERLFAPVRIGIEQLQHFLTQLHRLGLVVADAEGQGDELRQRWEKQRRKRRAAAGLNVLAIRLPGVNPRPLLDWLGPRVAWLFTPAALGLGMILIVAALTLVAVQFDAVRAKLPSFTAFFCAANVGWLAATLVGIMIVHELSHALTCRHFGGACREIGLMLLIFTPVLYCDVSDAWMIKGKWRRIAVSAAGMIAELLLAAIATFLWWFSEPGLFNVVCLNVMFVCSVSTLVINGNPLLRYDGYYILADLVDTPNLAEQARGLVRRAVNRWLALPDASDERWFNPRQRALLWCYGLAAPLYRWCLLFVIAWFVYKVLEPYRLEVLAVALTVTVVLAAAAPTAVTAAKRLRSPVWRSQVRRGRLALGAALLLSAAVGIGLLPLPASVTAPAGVELEGGRRAYATAPGTLRTALAPGTRVAAGETLAELSNPELQRELAALMTRVRAQRARLKGLELRLTSEPAVAADLVAAKELLSDLDQQRRALQAQDSELTLAAPIAGVVFPPPAAAAWRYEPGVPPAREGTPLDQRNEGCALQTGDLIAVVGDPNRFEVVALVEQSDLERVRVGQAVQLNVSQLPGEIIAGRVLEIAQTAATRVPHELAAGQYLARQQNDQRHVRAAETLYEVRIALSQQDGRLRLGARAWAKIRVDSQNFFQRTSRWLQRTFRIEL